MHQYVFFVTLVVLYVHRFDEVCCHEDLTPADKLEYWKRDAKYDAMADSLNYIHRRIFEKQKIYRLHSAQRRWEKQQRATAMEKLKRLFNSQATPNLRRHQRNHSHGPNHRHKKTRKATTNIPHKSWSSVATGPTQKQQLYSKQEQKPPTSNNTKHMPKNIYKKKRLGVLQHLPVHLADKPDSTASPGAGHVAPESDPGSPTSATDIPVSKKMKEEKSLSPYSLAKELNTEIIPKFPDLNITVEVLGRTVEYNDILLMKITKNSTRVMRAESNLFEDDATAKRIVFIVHGLSVMGFNQLPCMKNMEYVLKLFSYYFEHLDLFDIYLMPMANPDGVAASTMKSFWNKNMSPQSACPGVALDRNFDIGWNESFGSLSSCGQQYPGATPFSEVETQAIRDVFLKYGHKMTGYLNVHAGTYSPSIFKGDAVLYPKGFTDTTNDDDKYIDLRSELEEMIREANFKVYSVTMDTLHSWYGKVFGTSVDFAAVVYGVPFSMELVMQLYEDDMMVEDTNERETGAALTEVWSRVIRTIFPYMYRTYAKSTVQ